MNTARAAERYTLTDPLHLWWLQDPARPRGVGTLRHVRDRKSVV